MNDFHSFLADYYKKVAKAYLILVVVIIPIVDKKVVEAVRTYQPQHIEKIKAIFETLNPFWIWLAAVVILLTHIYYMYKLWKENQSTSSEGVGTNTVTRYKTGMNTEYESITRHVENYIPNQCENFNKALHNGYQSRYNEKGITTTISSHFEAYTIIKNFLGTYFERSDVSINTEMLKIKDEFSKNYLQLEKYNNECGTNSLSVSEHAISELLDNINDNVKSLFVAIKS